MGEQKTALTLLLILCLALSPLPLVKATEDSWTTLEPMPTARSCLGVAVVDGKIYAIGGLTGRNRWLSNVTEMYDAETDTWVTKMPMPTPRAGFGIAVVDNRIYCIGGWDADGEIGVNEVYDPVTDMWETKTSMPTVRWNLCACAVNGKIYVIGGRTYPEIFPYVWTISDVNEVYDPETDTWDTKAPIPNYSPTYYYPENFITSSSVHNKIYVIAADSAVPFRVYNPATDTWISKTPMPTPEEFWASAATTGEFAPIRIHLFMRAQSHVSASHEIYDPETDTYTIGTLMPTLRREFGVAVVNDELYVIGGYGNDYTLLAVNEKYTPIDYIPEFPSWIILPLFLVAALFGIITGRKIRTSLYAHLNE
jgi:N-acetylneuraminic acid mutarotase